MYFALSLSGQRVSAKKAVRGGRYICIRCRAPVYLRRGKIREAHFAHLHATANEECDLYHHAEPSTPVGQFPTRESESPVQELVLDLVLERPILSSSSSWHLCVRFPVPERSQGRFRFIMGGLDSRELLVRSLVGQTFYLKVPPSIERYRAAWVSDETDFHLKCALRAGCDGLPAEGVLAFSNDPGRYLQIAPYLEWGKSYFLIHRCATEVDDCAGLIVHAQRAQRDWVLSLVSLPHHPDARDRQKIEDRLNYPCEKISTSLILLDPQEYFRPDGTSACAYTARPILIMTRTESSNAHLHVSKYKDDEHLQTETFALDSEHEIVRVEVDDADQVCLELGGLVKRINLDTPNREPVGSVDLLVNTRGAWVSVLEMDPATLPRTRDFVEFAATSRITTTLFYKTVDALSWSEFRVDFCEELPDSDVGRKLFKPACASVDELHRLVFDESLSIDMRLGAMSVLRQAVDISNRDNQDVRKKYSWEMTGVEIWAKSCGQKQIPREYVQLLQHGKRTVE